MSLGKNGAFLTRSFPGINEEISMKYFFDTYALIEIIMQNPGYRSYTLSPIEACTTAFNLMELHFYYLKNFGNEEAERMYTLVSPLIISTDDDIIKDANKLKLANLKKRLSFTDCIGYITALKLNLRFVTGDYAFKGMENVEFVK